MAAGWFDYGKANRQASLVVEPADGRIPPLTEAAQAREAAKYLDIVNEYTPYWTRGPLAGVFGEK